MCIRDRAEDRFGSPYDQPGNNPVPPYPQAPAPAGSSRKLLFWILGIGALLFLGGCGALAYSLRDEIADGAIDFSDAVPVDGPVEDISSCSVIGIDLIGTYDIEASIEPDETAELSHYQLSLEVFDSDGTGIAKAETVLRSVAPGEQRTENIFNEIPAELDFNTVSCSVASIQRVPAE